MFTTPRLHLFAQGLTAQGFQLLRDYRVGGLGAKRAVQVDTQKGIDCGKPLIGSTLMAFQQHASDTARPCKGVVGILRS